MKNFGLMKIFVIGVIFTSAMIFSANCSAAVDYLSIDVNYLKNFIGNWYDNKGNLVLKIGSNYTINDCKVLAVYCDGEYSDFKVKINESSHSRDIFFSIFPQSSKLNANNYHDLIKFNGKYLHRDKIPRHYESIGGIYLGMSQYEVLKLYGEPSKKENDIWKYNNDGFEILFFDDIVGSVKIFPNGNRRFDRTGLSAKSSVNDFINKYSPKDVQYGRNTTYIFIGYDEFIAIRSNEVELHAMYPLGGYR